MIKSIRIFLFIAAAILLFFSGCGKRDELVSGNFIVMGTQASVTIRRDAPLNLAQALKLASETMLELEKAWSVFDPESEVSRINRNAGLKATPVSADTTAVLHIAGKFSKKTDGMFDITVGPLLKTWGFHGGLKPESIPSQDQIRKVLDKTGYSRIHLSGESVFLEKSGMTIDLGGIAKGVAVDRVCAAFIKAGITDALVNLGGDIRCIGLPVRNPHWVIGVRNPFDHSEILGTIRLEDGRAVATSGNYERFVVIEGERYAHIIDPHTGTPVTGMAGVTVVCDSAMDADIMSTALFVAGVDGYGQFADFETLKGALLVPDKKPLEILVDRGMKEIFIPSHKFRNHVSLIEE